jgi:hypothetical protein
MEERGGCPVKVKRAKKGRKNFSRNCGSRFTESGSGYGSGI